MFNNELKRKNITLLEIDDLNCMTDLHLHLDGAISLESAKKLAKAQGIHIPDDDKSLLSIMRVSDDCRDLNEFLEKFDFPCSLLQTKEGIKMAVENLLTELKEQGVMYTEIRFAPQKLTDKGLTQEETVIAAIEGKNNIDGIDCNFILCCMRSDDNHEENIETINVAEKKLNNGVVAVDLAGAEALFKTHTFEDIFALAKKKNIPFTIHAGEADGVESVKKAIEFGAKRIGHGVHSIDDPNVLKVLSDKNIALELCLTSNINTSIIKKVKDWPLKEFMESGICATINTDDPSIEGTTIKEEYKKISQNFDIDMSDIKQLLTNSVNASFADKSLKEKLLKKIEENIK